MQETKQSEADQRSTSLTSTFAIDMTQKNYDPVIGRDKEIEKMIEVLSRKNKANPILVGEAGVGKTALLHGLVQRIKEGNVPTNLVNKKIFSIDLSLLGKELTGMKYIIDEIIASGDILFIDEIHNIVGAGQTTGSLDLANIMKPILTNGSLMCIGATTFEEYRRYFEKDVALERRFSKIKVEEPSFKDCTKMLKVTVKSFENHHGVKIDETILEPIIKLSQRYITDRNLPDKAFDILDIACSKKGIEINKIKKAQDDMQRYQDEYNWEKVSEIKYNVIPMFKDSSDKVQLQDILCVISDITGIPITQLSKTEKEKLLNLELILKKRIIGQDNALEKISNHVRTSRVGIKKSNCSFLFRGPSGVGKTETAKALAELLFNSEDCLLRFDMSEYKEKHALYNLIGAPKGYVGYEDGGTLTEAVRRKPHSVILFDEVEKAHPEVYDTLLQVLDDGVLTDNTGRKIDFKNTVIIMTSNLTEEQMGTFFREEFLNRIDEIIIFNTLTKKDTEKIARYKLNDLVSNLEKEQGFSIKVSDNLVKKIVDISFSTKYGAREIERIIHSNVEVPLSKKILNDEIKDGELIILK